MDITAIGYCQRTSYFLTSIPYNTQTNKDERTNINEQEEQSSLNKDIFEITKQI